jgi:tRNA modification GTPase
MSDTIYALSSGAPPAAIAVVRISGPQASSVIRTLCGRVPPGRRASLVEIREPASGELLDTGLAISFPGPASATGEDLAELHLHGGRAIVRSVLRAISDLPGVREAQPGEFTRRAFENGRIDLAEAEGLADLLEAETESQRRAALALAGGALSRLIADWQQRLLAIAAQVEAVLDFSDEGDVGDDAAFAGLPELDRLIAEIRAALARPEAERLKEGIRVAIAGPPNAGKSTLLNYLAGREAAITSPMAGTTRDLIEAPTSVAGTPLLLIDTAGLRDSADEIESIGVQRAERALAAADLVLWLGDPGEAPPNSIVIKSKADLVPDSPTASSLAVSPMTGEGMRELSTLLVRRSQALLPKEGEVTLNRRHRSALRDCLSFLEEAACATDFIIRSEGLRRARLELGAITGEAGVEQMLDALFGRFCIGK